MPEPLLPVSERFARRDPAVIEHDGVVHCFHTVVDVGVSPPELWVDVTTSADLRSWTAPRRVTPPGPNFSSPGNVLRVGDEWVMVLQSYPIEPGQDYGSDASTLWLARSIDLVEWSDPVAFDIAGPSERRIDPFLIAEPDGYVCLYKTRGTIAALRSDDLERWTPVDEPVLSPADTPDGVTVENPAVLRVDDEYVLLFAPCRADRGVGVARGRSVLDWSGIHYLDLPGAEWAPGGWTAAVALPTPWRERPWALFVHGDTAGAHGGALTVFEGDDLTTWHAIERNR